MGADAHQATRVAGASSAVDDGASQRWVVALDADHPRREETIAELHAVLRRCARHELSRRRGQLGAVSGPEFDDLVQQAADDALVKVLAKREQFAGLSRFTTWACKFVIFEISRLVSRHAWQRQPPGADEHVLERLAESPMADPAHRLERQEQIATLAEAVDRLSGRQREVFVAVALNDTPIDVVAIRLHSSRNAVYKNLFDARRRLRTSLAAAGHPVFEEDADRDR